MAKQKRQTSGPGRPPVNDPRMTKRNQIRSYPNERWLWNVLARRDGRSFSDYNRRLLNDKIACAGITEADVTDADREAS